MIIEPVRPDERQALLALAVATGLFTESDAEGLLGGVLDGLAGGTLPPAHAAVTCRTSAEARVAGWTYFAPDPYSERVWNLWWIGVLDEYRGTGVARALLSHVERTAAASSGRILVIETSDAESMARARGFYARHGYSERGRVPDFYADGEAKVVFSRSLAGPPRGGRPA